MGDHPYTDLPPSAYWRTGVADMGGAPNKACHTPKWPITRSDRIVTAGSCFAQHMGRFLKREGFNVLDAEPAPELLPISLHGAYGYGIYSGRYGNVYTARQMLQLAQEALGQRPLSTEVWERDGACFDALRPTIDVGGHGAPDAVLAHRKAHVSAVRELLLAADILVFTLGLTETWENVDTGRVYPVCPGVVAGQFDDRRFRFRNLTFHDTLEDMRLLRNLLCNSRSGEAPKMLLTVSPVPLTATVSGKHVMQATVYSKAVLRSVAGYVSDHYQDVDYFPSYEIVANPWTKEQHYESNFRTFSDKSVQNVMQVFMNSYIDEISIKEENVQVIHENGGEEQQTCMSKTDLEMAIACDEELLDIFGPRNV